MLLQPSPHSFSTKAVFQPNELPKNSPVVDEEEVDFPYRDEIWLEKKSVVTISIDTIGTEISGMNTRPNDDEDDQYEEDIEFWEELAKPSGDELDINVVLGMFKKE